MLTYPKSTMRVRRMPMHLSSGHVTLMPGKFYLFSLIFFQSDLGCRGDSRWALPQIFGFIFFFPREIFKMRRPTSVKFCTMVSIMSSFIMPVKNFLGGTPQQNFKGQKHAKFGPISVEFEVRRRYF